MISIVWCIDARNHGDTIHTENGMDFITLTSDAINFCNEMKIKKGRFFLILIINF